MGKITEFKNFIIKNVFLEIKDTLESLEEDYLLLVDVSDSELLEFLKIIYDYYVSLGIGSDYIEMVLMHFNDLAIIAIDNDSLVNMDFIVSNYSVLELNCSCSEVNPREVFLLTSKVLKKEGK